MTQSPQPPQMPPPEPLDEAERAIAHALRNLPSGSPPPELDARILGAARRAVHLAPPRKRDGRRWLVGFGTAATALFAVGVMLKTHGPAQDAIYTPPAETTAADAARAPVNAPASEAPAQSMPAADSADQSATGAAGATAATIIEPPPPPPPSPEVMQSSRQQKDMAAQPRGETSEDHYSEAAKAAPQAFPAAPPKSQYIPPPPPPLPPAILDEATPMSVPAPSAPPSPAMAMSPAPPAPPADERERKAEAGDSSRRDTRAGGMAAQAPASATGTIGRTEQDQAASKQAANPASNNALAKEKSLDQITVAGSRVKRADAPLPAPAVDAGLSPREWIERIRERVRDGDHAGAVASLHALVARHPETAIPDDLQPLLR